MKKLLAFLLVCLMVVPFGVLAATGVSAAEGVVYYVREGGSGDGSTATNAFGSLMDAFDKAATHDTTDVTIVVVGEVNVDMAAGFTAPEHKNKITVTGSHGTFTGGKLILATADRQHWVLTGALEFNNIEITMTGPSLLFRCHFYPFTVGENVITPAKTYLVGGIQHSEGPAPDGVYDADTNTFTGNPNLTLLSGTFEEICIWARGGFAADIPMYPILAGNAKLYLGGTASINKLLGTRVGNLTTGSTTIYLDGGAVNKFVCHNANTAASITGTVKESKYTVVVTDNFNIANSFGIPADTGFLPGIAGGTLRIDAVDSVMANEDFGDYRAFIEAGVWENVVASEMINITSFDSINKIESATGLGINETTPTPDTTDLVPPPPPETQAPATKPADSKPAATKPVTTKPTTTKPTTNKGTDAATTKAPVTTDNATDNEGSAPIGLIIGIAAAVVVAGVVVIIVVKKKKS